MGYLSRKEVAEIRKIEKWNREEEWRDRADLASAVPKPTKKLYIAKTKRANIGHLLPPT